ncbi:quinoprotein relay system zinc metallohydrolase 2 [Nitrogeniibacter mangrovi]|uniref:Quinoprotein relay system zinc metallohydrolase 2 n=1 Tax=Nitrogeniibacter mangrovi TaxID=2016596 RepID=A0A6C1B3K7_9RHOO|nr:quinoprotein relay system zinc metallohydrolase 2 [Nitrogeniibacter mangrovi]QID17435.1 quinoprotein relay system zinc metallohydrolase 2 [Nitrogeniibacter mangrovi]
MNRWSVRVLGALGLALVAWAARAGEAYRFDELAPGVYLHTGVHAEPTPANQGDIANKGVVIGDTCVAVIDTGGSLADGQALLAAVRRVTPKPVCYVIDTHMHPDHLFGNAAFDTLAPRPVFIADHRLPPALAQRAAIYLKRWGELLGRADQGTRVVPPDRLVDGRMTLDLGGRTLVLQGWPTAHTNNDLTVFDPASGVLWLGDLLFRERIPSLDGSLEGWLAVSKQLRAIPAKIAVPGHGPAGTDWQAALDRQDAYFQALARRVRQAIADGRTLSETVAATDPAEASGWLLAPAYHTRNVTAAFAELEWE